jgi:RNA polymerase sigma-70 factor (ECF subfamily)
MTLSARHAGQLLGDEIRRAAGRDPAMPFDRLYEEYCDFVWRSACRLGVDGIDADDLVQEVFFVAHRRLQEFEGRASAKTWLFGILHHVLQHHFRSHARKHRHLSAGPHLDPDRLPDVHAAGPAESAEQSEALRILDHLLGQIDEQRRVVFVLAEIEQMTAGEIAEAVGINVNTVYSRLRVARQEFESALRRHRDGEARRMGTHE